MSKLPPRNTLNSQQLADIVDDLLHACSSILERHGLQDHDCSMMQMMLLSYAVGDIIGSATDFDHRDAVIGAAVQNIRKGIARYALGADGEFQALPRSCLVH